MAGHLLKSAHGAKIFGAWKTDLVDVEVIPFIAMDGVDVMRASAPPPECSWRQTRASPSPRILQSLLSYHFNQKIAASDIHASVHQCEDVSMGSSEEIKEGLGLGVPTPPASNPGSPVPQQWLTLTPLTAPASPASSNSPAPSLAEYRDRCNSNSSNSSCNSSSWDQSQETGRGRAYRHHQHYSQNHPPPPPPQVNTNNVCQPEHVNLKRPSCPSTSNEDQPMDLSCPKKARHSMYPAEDYTINECVRQYKHHLPTSRNIGHQASVQECLNVNQPPRQIGCTFESDQTETHNSILKSILCGKLRSSGCDGEDTDHNLMGGENSSGWFPQLGSLSGSTGLTRSPHARVEDMINKAKEAARQKNTKPSPDQVTIQTETAVTLAKKNLFPVRARVSDWLLKMVQFAKSVPEFVSLPHNDKVTLILNAWSRLMLLYMADTNFQFAVTPCSVPPTENATPQMGRSSTPLPATPPAKEAPTMRTVEAIQLFIRKCQTLALDAQELTYLRLIALFHPGK